MSGPPNQPPYGGGRMGGWNARVSNPTAPSPSFLYRPPSPWTPVAPSPPPIISGPRRNSMQSPGPMSPPPHAMSPGPQGLRGTRAGSQSRPHWSGPQPYGQQTQQQHYQPVHAPSPTPFNGHGPKPTYSTYSPINVPAHHPMSSFQLSPSPSPLIFQSQPPPEYFYQSPYGNGGSNSNHHAINRPQEYVGAPMEPPLPKSYVVYDDEEETGPSTREIIANQSQDYIDEKLAEYQMTILQLQEEQERVQKKTFTNWINSYLSKRIPPLRVDDLINDLRDGTKLLALLEVLSGEKLPVEKGRVLRRPHFLSNANTALQFLASKRIKLVNINPADLVDGRPPVVLGLIWTIILYFQIEENSRVLEYLGHGISGSVSSLDSVGRSSDVKAEKWKQGARKTLLNWVTNALPQDVQVKDFGASWRDGVAFLALIDAIKANIVNMAELKKATNRQRLETAFDVAEAKLGIAKLLDAEDVDVPKPDEKSIMTYVAQFLHKYPEPKNLLKEVLDEKDNVEELNDQCELLMEQTACSRVRDETIETQANYTKLLTSAQGLVSKIEKSLSDHTEFLNYKNEMDNWINKAKEVLAECTGEGDLNMISHQLETINSLSSRLPEGQHLLSMVQDAYSKAIHVTPEDQQDKLRGLMTKVREDWDALGLEVKQKLVDLKQSQNRWSEFASNKQKLEKWIAETEAILGKPVDTKGELSEMKTLLERFKILLNEINQRGPQFENLQQEAKQLGSEIDEVNRLQGKWEKLKNDCNDKIKSVESEINEYNSYYQNLQDVEKWLLQVSFQLMAHNSLFISNREQTQEQLSQHENLLDEIQKYQTNIDDLNTKGQAQIRRYEEKTPSIRGTVEEQLKNIQESYNSLLHTSVQIKNRLLESLAKFQEYENTLDSIMKNLEEYEPIITNELDAPATTLEMAQTQLQTAQNLNNKLQAEKSRLAAAVQACEAATASISRPSSPLESAMQAIPERELVVRAKLEDLLDQVQSHLGGLTATVSELEQQQKQRAELQDWIKKQQSSVADWLSRPCKLRPEAAKQELVAMNDLLNAVGDKRSQLMTDMTGSFADEDSTPLENNLDQLESELMDAIAKKQSSQNIIDDYRNDVQDMQNWFDSLIKRMDVLEKGSGLNCAQKLDAISEIKKEFEGQGPQKLQNIKNKAAAVCEIISNLDGQQVDEQVKSLERRYNDVGKRIDRKAQLLDVTNKGVEGAKDEIEQISNWVKEKIAELQAPSPMGYDVKSGENRQQALKGMMKDAEAKQSLAATLTKRINNMQPELEASEYSQLEAGLRNLGGEQKNLTDLLKAEMERALEATRARKAFESDLEKARAWVKNKLAEVRKQPAYHPLASSEIEKDIQVNKKYDDEAKQFNEGLLSDVLKQSNAILKDCPQEDKERLQKVLDEINADYNTLKDENANVAKALADLLAGRKEFEKSAKTMNDWLNEAETATSGDIRTANLHILEEQLAHYKKLADNAAQMNDLMNTVADQAKGISPSLSNPDKLKLNEEVKNMKDKYAKINNNINNRLKELEDHIKKHKDAKNKLAECQKFLAAMKQRLRELNKPIGSKIEDVQELLGAYEGILKELKDSKNKMGELSGDDLPELQSLMTQQDDMIKLIEDQLAHLRQLLLLREQFIALINDIIAFIVKYTDIVADIEKNPCSLEEKINKYDDVIGKIQECEALLSSAYDKGQQIASEGTSADQNSINDQLQSLKNQLQNLRKTVEAQRQKHQLQLEHHKKLAEELADLLDKLHDNEGLVKSRPLLDRDPESVEREIQKHHELAADVNENLKKLDKMITESQNDITMPDSLLEMFSEGRSLLATLPKELEEREKYLIKNRDSRLDYMKQISMFNEWIHEAEIRLQNGQHGIDYFNLSKDLDEHKAFFGNDGPIKNLVNKEIQGAADRIWPSLSGFEQDELSREMQNLQQKLRDVLSSAKNQQGELEKEAENWKIYCHDVEKVKSNIDLRKLPVETVSNLAGLHYAIQTVTHAIGNVEQIKPELDSVNQQAQGLIRKADAGNRQAIENSNADLNKSWSDLLDELKKRRDSLHNLAENWNQLEDKLHSLEKSIERLEDKFRHVDSVVRSRRHLEETKNVIQEILGESEDLKSAHREIETLSKSIVGFLGEAHKSSVEAILAKVDNLAVKHKKLNDTLREKDKKVTKDLNEIENIFRRISELQDRFNSLAEEISEVHVFDENTKKIEEDLNKIREKLNRAIAESKDLIKDTREKYTKEQNLLPTDIGQELQALELLSERLQGAMETKEREFKRAKTVRTEYLSGVDEIKQWLQKAEVNVQDRTLEPLKLKEVLQRIGQEITGIYEKLDHVKGNGKIICESSRNSQEKNLVQNTIDQLQQELDQVKSWLDEKKQQVGDSLDAWTRFMNLYQIVMQWAADKRTFINETLNLTTLQLTKQKLNEYSTAVKSIKPIIKNLHEMNKELDHIGEVTNAGDLKEKLQEAEDAKTSVEAILLERNSLLQETCEEWDQCEKKVKDIRAWIEKTRNSLDSPQHKKKPLRDQLGFCEKTVADINIQKTKLRLSIEKLEVHFRNGIGGDPRISENVDDLLKVLDELNDLVKTKTSSLEETLQQIDVYQQQMQTLRQKIIQEEQQLRLVIAPTYLPHDRERALAEQQLIQQNLEDYRKEANRLKQASQNVPTDPQRERLINESIDRIDLLMLRSQQGTQMIENAMISQRKRQDEIDRYNIHLKEIEEWLQGALVELKDVEHLPTKEEDLLILLKSSQDLLKNLKEKEESLATLLENTQQLHHHEDVAELAKPLSEQLQQIISILREQITVITTRIYTIETRITQGAQAAKPKAVESGPVSLDDRTIDSMTSMPEEEVKPAGYTVETQTSQIQQSEIEAQTSFPIEQKIIDTIESSVQTTKERKPTENILVTQKIQDGQETIQIDTIPNVEIPEQPEDVLIEARYHQKPQGDVSRSTELVIKNVPESFETTFVEPDETTTEVVVDPDGTKRIIVKKITKTRHQVTQRTQQQQISTISTLIGEGEQPQLQSVQVVNLENKETIQSGDGDGVLKTVITQQSKGSVAQGTGPETVIVEEFESAPIVQEIIEERPEGVEYQGVPVHEGDVTYLTEGTESTIRAVVQQVTRKIIKKTRKIIKRVVVIDGVEHITEEVVEEPEEIEVTEEEMAPNVNVSIIRTVNGQVVTEEEYNRLMAETQSQEQVFEIPHPQTPQSPAQVELLKSFEKAPVDVTITEVDTRTSTPLSTSSTAPPSNVTDQKVEVKEIVTTIIDELQDKALQNIDEIWPKEHHLQPSEIEHSEHKGDVQVLPQETYKEEIWPLNLNTGSDVKLEDYAFEAKPLEVIAKEEVTKPVIVGFEKKQQQQEQITITEESIEPSLTPVEEQPKSPEHKTASITITTTSEELSVSPEIKESPKEVIEDIEQIKKSEVTEPSVTKPAETASITITTTEEQLQSPEPKTASITITTTSEELSVAPEIKEPPKEVKSDQEVPSPQIGTISIRKTEVELVQPKEIAEEPHSLDTDTYSISEPSLPEDNLIKKDAPAKQVTDIKTATQLFITGEMVGPKVITVTAPSVEDNGESTLKVTMAPTDKTRVNLNIIESTITETERDDTSRSEIELDTKRNRKKKKRKEKEEVLKQQPSEEDSPKEMPIPQEKSHSISEVETPRETGYEPEDKTLDETDADDTKKKRKKKKKQKVKAKEDEDTHVPVSSKDSDMDTTLSIESEGKVHQEAVTEISPESELGSLSEAATVKIVEESVISPDSDSLHEPNKELLMPKNVLEVTYVEDVEQQTSPRVDEPQPKEPVKDIKSAQTSPVHMPVETISQQTSFEVPDLADTESQTLVIESTDVDIQTTPRQEPQIISEEITRVIPDVDVAIQEVPELTDSSMQIVVESKETEQQTTPRQDEPLITTGDIVKPLVADIVHTITQDIKEPTADQSTHTETIEITQTSVQTSPRPDEASAPILRDVPTQEQQTTTEIVETVDSNVQTQPTEEKEDDTSLSTSEPYNLDIHATVAIPPDSECPNAEPIVYHYTQTVELPKKKKKGKKTPGDEKKSDGEVNINVEIDKCMAPCEGSHTPHAQQPDSKKPSLATLTIQRTTTTTTFPENEPVVEEEVKSQVVKQKQRSRPTSTVMIEEVMSPTEEIDVPLTPGAAPESPVKLWSIPKSDDVITTETKSIHQYPIHDVVEVINDSLRQLESDEKPTELTNILQLATIGEDIVEQPVENRIQEVNDSIEQLENAIRRGDQTIIQTTVITVVEKVSTWLKTIEYRVYLIRQQSNEGPSEKKVDDYSKLGEEIHLIKQNVTNLEANIDKIPDKEPLELCINKLKSYVTAVEGATKDRQNQEIKDLERWNEFLITIYNITTIINNSNDRYDNIVSLEAPLDTKVAALEQLETEILDTQVNVGRILNRAHSIQRDFPGKDAEIPEDIYNAMDVCRNIQNNIIQERDRLLQLQSLAEEYEQTLKEFANITIIADKLVESPIVCKNLDELHAAIQKHRKFFVNLSHCKALLESLQENIDVETREKHANLHNELYGRANTLLDKATDRAQKLAQAASKWSVLDKGMKDERQWLQVAHQRVPDLSTVTSADYEQYAHLYTSLNNDISHHHAKMIQLSNTAEKLQDLIEAPKLVEESNESLITLLKLQEDVASYLHRLLRFKEIWTLYEGQTEKLEAFIRNSEKELHKIHIPDDPRAQPIEHIRQFWEVKAQFEMHNNLRGDIANSLEKSLEIIPLADEMLQRQFYGQLEDRWNGISGQISAIEGAILNGISSDDLPQSEKLEFLERELKEIYLSMTGMKGVIKSEDDLLLYIERIQVLNKRVALIGNELGRIGIQDESEPEKIGELFALSQKITNHIAEELENSTVLRDQLMALKEGIDAVRKDQARMSVALDECEQCENKEKEVVESAVTDCQQIAEDLIASWQEIMRLRQLLHTLPLTLKMTVSPTKLEREIAKLQDEHAFLETRCTNILTILTNRLTVWKRYEKQLDMVHDSVNEAGFMMDLLKIQGNVDYERLKKATERLEGLSSELQSRENLIDDLKSSAKPLVDSCDGDIVEQIESAVQGACVAWNDTTDNLQTLCTKYQKAVELWQKYQKASATVKHWVEQQMETLDTLNLHSAHHHKPAQNTTETLQHVKVCENNLNDQNEKLNELRDLVSKIASNVGLDASHMFQGELESLGKRLQEVKDTITTLADVAENQEKEHIEFDENLNEARVYLKTVQQDLSTKPTTQKESEQQLAALRDHLSALTKTEEQLKDLQTRPNSDTTIIEVLTLWQKIFKETFTEYHRLSSRLVKGQNSSEALKLWKQYLDHVQSFLNVQIPENYSSLKEHRHLCEIHKNLLAQQQQMYLSQPIDEAVSDQYKSLTNLHNDTLVKIVSRNSEIESRIELWNKYRVDLQQLLDWLKDREAEKSRLQLRYIHLKRVAHLKQRIDHILSQLPSGKQMAMNIKDQQDDLFKFCDDSLAASVRMEHASAQQRISNLDSSLQTWRDFLSKIANLNQRYMEIRSRLSREFDDVQNLINDTTIHLPTNANAMDEMIRILQNQRIRVAGVAQDLEEMNVIQEELKECISPHDMKPIRRNVWSLWQQQSDLDMQLLTLINTMEDRASMHKVFNSRYDRVQIWMTNLEKRIEKDVDLTLRASQNPEEAVKVFEKEINSDMNLREKEKEWLMSSGRELISLYEDNPEYREDVQAKLNALIDQWERLKYITKLKSNKIKDLRMTLLRLEERMSQIRQWMFKMETELAKPIILESHAPAVIESKIKEVDQIQRSIKNESSNVGEVFNLCEMLLNDADAWKTHFNTANLSTNVKNLEKRWVDVCKSADKRKRHIVTIWNLLQTVIKITTENKNWLAKQETEVSALERDLKKLSREDIQKRIDDVMSKIKEIESQEPNFKQLEQAYAKLAMAESLDQENIQKLTMPTKVMLMKWKNLIPRCNAVIDTLSLEMKLYRNFTTNQTKVVNVLTDIESDLAKIQELKESGDPKELLKRLEKLEKKLVQSEEVLKEADNSGNAAKDKLTKENVAKILLLIREYTTMWQEIQTMIITVKKDLSQRVAAASVAAVETVVDASKQFNVQSKKKLGDINRMTSITPKDAYTMELATAIQECRDHLDEFQKVIADKLRKPGPQKIQKLTTSCSSSVELMRHLSNLLVTECSASPKEAEVETVNDLTLRFETLLSQWKARQQHEEKSSEVGRLTCPLCTQRNWQQIDNDLWRLEQWLQFAESTQSSQITPPTDIELLEDVAQDQREFLLDLESHKSIIASLNVVGDHLATHTLDTDKAKQLRARLEQNNDRWNQVCINATTWQGLLQTALMGNKEFHNIIDELCGWLQETEQNIKASEPVDLTEDRNVLEVKFRRFKELRAELERCEPRVVSLQDAADQLLKSSGGDEADGSTNTYTRLTDLRLRLQSLRRLSGIYIVKLGAVLGYDGDKLGTHSELLDPSGSRIQATSSAAQTSLLTDNANAEDAVNGDAINTTVLARGYRFLGRVVRASLPIQALMLLLLGVATLVPHGDEYSCMFSNTFARSLEPMLTYPNGPPPT